MIVPAKQFFQALLCMKFLSEGIWFSIPEASRLSDMFAAAAPRPSLRPLSSSFWMWIETGTSLRE